MTKTIRLLAAAMAAVIGAGSAWADAGTQVLTRDTVLDSTRSCDVAAGRTCYFSFDTAGENSKVFVVPTANAVACIDGNTASSAASTSSVKFWRVINAGTEAGSLFPSAATTAELSDADADCFTMPTGLWWIEVESVDSAFTGLVAITGRDSQ
jgi:hypothetical protein